MNNLLEILQDSTGQLSSTRVGKITIILCWAFNQVMHTLNPSIQEPSMVLTSIVLGAMGISVAQKAVEGKGNIPTGKAAK